MKIGVDVCCWGNKRGYGRFTRELLEAILQIDRENEYLFFFDKSVDEHELPASARKIFVNTAAAAIEAAGAGGRRSLADLLAMSRAVFRHKIDLFFFPTVYSYFPVFNRAKIIVTIHDLIADRRPELIFPNGKAKFFWKIKQNAAVRQSDLILTVSEFSRREIAGFFGLDDSNLRVIVEGAREIFKVLPNNSESAQMREKYGLRQGEKFLLCVGGISPHKNLGTLIEAFAAIAQNHEQLKLLLVGDYQTDSFFSAYPPLKRQITASGLDNRVIFTGFVSDEDLTRLYNLCELLVFPSLEEGFGLPALEAMACGAAVAASANGGSLPEVLGTAGAYFDPKNAADMAHTVTEIISDANLQAAMRQAGVRRSAQFRWSKAAAQTLDVFREIGREKRFGRNAVKILADSRSRRDFLNNEKIT